MPYFTSWDVNVFLCFLAFDIPWYVAKDMLEISKRIHESYILETAREFHCMMSPSLLYKKHTLGRWHYSTLARIPNKDIISEFKLAWQWRCPEVRRDLIIRTINFQNIQVIERLKYDFDPFNGRYRIDSDKEKPKKGRYHSSEGLWDVWSAWGTYKNKDRQTEEALKLYDNGFLLTGDRKKYIANWYKNIHEGRYFLFFKENNLTGYGRRKSKDINISEKVKRFGTIHNIGPFEQMAEDLLVIDGPGLGKSGSKIEHIDDIFVV